MQNTEASCEESERVIKKFKTSRSSLPSLVSYETLNEPESSQYEFCLFSKLLEIHHEENCKHTDEVKTGLKYNSFLLEKLVIKERLNTLILNLYPGNKGFSMAFRSIPRSELGSDDTANIIETAQWPYEDDDILRHIDNEELPPTLVDLFEMHYSHLFYSGCIIAEIRDYRQAYPHSNCDIHHVLLRPTLKSIMSDINNMVVENNTSASEEKDEWSAEERHMLESQILLADNPHICLDPDNTISESQLRLNHSRNMWNMHKFHRMARKFSQVTVNRKRKLDQFTHRAGLELYDYINRARTKPKSPNISSKLKKPELKPIPVPNLDSPAIGPPSQGVVINEFKAYQPPVESNDYLPQIVEEYVLETKLPPKDKNKQRVYHIKLSILQRPSNSEYLGELYLDRDHKENERNGVACRFTLGTRMHVNKYLQQFSETFTKSGRQSVVMRRGGRNANFKISMGQLQQSAAHSSVQQKQQQQSINQPQQQTQQVVNLPNHIINGTVSGGKNIVQNQVHTSTSSTPVLQSHLQSTSTATKPAAQTLTNQQLEINALAIKLMNFGQEFQAAAHAKQQEQQRQLQQQQQQQQKASSNANNTIINLLNSAPASSINNDANTVVVNAINNSSLLSQQIQTGTQQKILTPRKMTVMNLPSNARVIGHAGNLVMNNSRLAELNNLNSGQQTITLTSVNSNESFSYTAVPVKQQVINQRVVSTSNESNKQTALSALLVGTPAADRPDIISSNTSSLLLEKLASSSSSNSSQGTSQSFLQNPNKPQQFVVQSPKISTVQSPMSSPSQQTTNTINVQSLKLSQLQSLAGLQNVQVQLPGFSQPISLSSAGNLQGHPTGLLVSVPVASSSATTTMSQAANNGTGVVNTGPTVVLANAAGLTSLAQLVSGMKNLNQQGIRQGVPATVSLSQGQPFQLITSLQGQRLQQANLQQNLTARTIQRTPITIKMATTSSNTNTSQVTINTNTLNQQLQKQVQLQQYQQLCLNQQQNVAASLGGKLRRRSNTSTDPQ